MAKCRRKPWWHKARQTWYVTVGNRQINLRTEDETQAIEQWHKLLAKLADAPEAKPTVDGSLSVSDLVLVFLDDLQASAKPATYQWYRRYLEQFAKRIPAGLPAIDLRRRYVEDWVRAEKFTHATSRAAIRSVKRMFAWAVEREHLQVSPINALKIPKGTRRETLLTDEQVAKLLAEASAEFLDLLTVSIETGCRPQEVRLIEARHVVNGVVVMPATEHKTGAKTGSARTIFLTSAARSVIDRLCAAVPSGPLFRNSVGKPWTSNAIRCRMRRLRAKHDVLPKDLCLYHLRHTYATQALVNGVNPEELRILLGHSSTKMIAEHYSHLAKVTSHMQEAAERARGLTGRSA